eukprot:792639-Pelagomonas_calceolata.AAC.5
MTTECYGLGFSRTAAMICGASIPACSLAACTGFHLLAPSVLRVDMLSIGACALCAVSSARTGPQLLDLNWEEREVMLPGQRQQQQQHHHQHQHQQAPLTLMQRNNRRPPSAGEPYHAHHHPGAAQPAPPSEPATVLMGAAAGGHARVQHPPAHMAAPTPAGHAHEYPLPRGAPHAAATTAQPPRAPKDISSGTAAAAVSAAAASTNVWQKHAPAHQPAATQAQAAPKPGPPAAAMFGSFDEETLEKLTRQAGPAPQLQQQQQQPHPSRMLDDRSQMWRPGACMHCVCVVCAMASGAELKGCWLTILKLKWHPHAC